MTGVQPPTRRRLCVACGTLLDPAATAHHEPKQIEEDRTLAIHPMCELRRKRAAQWLEKPR